MKYINQLDYPHWLYVTGTDMDEENKNDVIVLCEKDPDKVPCYLFWRQ